MQYYKLLLYMIINIIIGECHINVAAIIIYYIKQYFEAKYLSLAAKCNFKTIHRSIENNYSCGHSVLHGVYCYTSTKL